MTVSNAWTGGLGTASGPRYDGRSSAILLAAMLLIAWLWDTWFIYPIQLFTVFLHELSHGIAAVLTGGSILKIELSSQLGGTCWHRGGWPFVVLPAGYLGSMLWGAAILVGAARTRYDKAIAMGLGVLMIFVGLAFVRPIVSFGMGFTLLFGAALFLLGKHAGEAVNDISLRILGLTSCLYAVFDIKDDLITRTVPISDAYRMSELLVFVPSKVVGVAWIILALLGTGYALHLAAGGPPPPLDDQKNQATAILPGPTSE